MPHNQPPPSTVTEFSLLTAFLVACICLLFGTSSRANDSNNSHFNFKADQMEFDTIGGINTLTGNAQISNASLSIKGHWIKIETRNSAIFRMSGAGKPIIFERLAGTNKLIKVQSEEIDYQTAKWTLVFTGNAVLTQPGWRLSGHTIEYNIRTKTIKSTGHNKHQVNITYYPGNQPRPLINPSTVKD